MGFLTGGIDKSVFNFDSYRHAIGKEDSNGYAVVRIMPNSNRLLGEERDPYIKGVYDSASNLTLNIEANWSSIGELGGISLLPSQLGIAEKVYGAINKFGSIGGLSNLGAGLSSQKIYQKSGYLTLRIPMIIVDWDGTGQPIMSSKLLASYCLPSEIAGKNQLEFSKQHIQKLYEDFKRKLKDVEDEGGVKGSAAGTTNKLVEGVENINKWSLERIEEIADKNPALMEAYKAYREGVGDLDDLYTLRASPPSVTVEIGQYFSNNNMVITGVEFEFSKEMTEAGPLFVKVNLSLSTRRILTDLSSIGLHSAQKKSRYLSVEGNEITDSAASNATGF